MFVFESSQVIEGDAESVWAAWADPDRFAEWDEREEYARLNGPFAPGSTIDSKQKGNPGGTATITAVEPGVRWSAHSPLPGGALEIDNVIEPAGPGRVRVGKRYAVTGPLTPLFRVWWGPRVLRAMPAFYAALQARAAEVRVGGS